VCVFIDKLFGDVLDKGKAAADAALSLLPSANSKTTNFGPKVYSALCTATVELEWIANYCKPQ
jgi:isocitrate/isopropylmalate dehydrogenase